MLQRAIAAGRTDVGSAVWPPALIRTERLVLRESQARDRVAFVELFDSLEAGAYAGVDDMRKTGDAKRVTLPISLLHQQRIEARDEVVTMFCKRMAALHKKAKERLAELQEAHRAETERLVGVLGEVLAGTREAITPPETAIAGAVASDAGGRARSPSGPGGRC
ncbi:hypothetical protein AB0J63_37330 [Streptosporangium canum]|uniref:hypothetical protein n=1 Tax=Streptosporangium canum TaxID=324952 RepID=UPI003435F78F